MVSRVASKLVALCCFALLTSCASGAPLARTASSDQGSASPLRATIPWLPLPAQDGASRGSSGDDDSPTCIPAALAVTAPAGGSAGGILYIPITVHNHGSTACILRDTDLEFSWGPGTHATMRDGTTHVLKQDGRQSYRIGFAGSCVSLASPPVTYTPVIATLSGSPLTTHGDGVPDFASSCTNAPITPDEPVDAEDAGTGPYSPLRAAIDLPAEVKAGVTLHYTVTLTNTGHDSVTFSSCPDYTEGVAVGRAMTKTRYTLNCDGLAIAPGATATFAMQIDLPAETGVAKFVWLMSNGPSATLGPVNVS